MNYVPEKEMDGHHNTILCIARLCHIGHGFLKFSLILLNSERFISGNVM